MEHPSNSHSTSRMSSKNDVRFFVLFRLFVCFLFFYYCFCFSVIGLFYKTEGTIQFFKHFGFELYSEYNNFIKKRLITEKQNQQSTKFSVIF